MNDTGERGDRGDRGIHGERGPKGDHGQHGDKGRQGVQGVRGPRGDTGEVGHIGETGPKIGFDWLHMMAYVLLAGAFIFTATENRKQTQDILKTGTASCSSINDLRGTLRSILSDQVKFAERFPTDSKNQRVRIEVLKKNIADLGERQC